MNNTDPLTDLLTQASTLEGQLIEHYDMVEARNKAYFQDGVPASKVSLIQSGHRESKLRRDLELVEHKIKLLKRGGVE